MIEYSVRGWHTRLFVHWKLSFMKTVSRQKIFCSCSDKYLTSWFVHRKAIDSVLTIDRCVQDPTVRIYFKLYSYDKKNSLCNQLLERDFPLKKTLWYDSSTQLWIGSNNEHLVLWFLICTNIDEGTIISKRTHISVEYLFQLFLFLEI